VISRLRSLRRFVRPAALTATTLMALLAAALWIDGYFHYINVNVGLWHITPLKQTSKEAIVVTYRDGIGVLLRRRFIPVDWSEATDELGWSLYGPGVHVGPSLAREQFAIGKPVVDFAGVYLGHQRGPHQGFGPTSRVVDYFVGVPLWLIVLLAGAWPTRVLVRRIRGRTRAGGAAFEVLTTADNPVPLPQAAVRS
jgi:hypothetical protein